MSKLPRSRHRREAEARLLRAASELISAEWGKLLAGANDDPYAIVSTIHIDGLELSVLRRGSSRPEDLALGVAIFISADSRTMLLMTEVPGDEQRARSLERAGAGPRQARSGVEIAVVGQNRVLEVGAGPLAERLISEVGF